MSQELVERLTLEKHQLLNIAQERLVLIGLLALLHGEKKKDGRIEYRISKSKLNAIEGYSVNLRGLKSGSLVITVRKEDDQ